MPIAPSEIGDAFRRAGVGRGDVLMLHADAIALAQLPAMAAERRFDILFEQLADVLGDEGTLVMPAFSYSAPKGEVFDPAATPSAVGALAEHFRTLPGVRRSLDPIFSVTARGRLAEDFAAAAVGDCFGPGSTFDLLARHDAWLACLGCPFLVTFTHYVEQRRGVSYRYFKTFPGKLRVGEAAVRELDVAYYVRDLARATDADLTRLSGRMLAAGTMAAVPVGRLQLTATRASAFSRAANALLDEDEDGLIVEGKGRA